MKSTISDDAELGPRWDALRERARGLAARVRTWANKLLGFESIGKTYDRENKFYVWRLGNTEQHCVDCLRLNGQVHTADQWRRAGIQPQSPDLTCGGWRCDCQLEEHPGPESGDF